jgi:hypothetical protein
MLSMEKSKLCHVLNLLNKGEKNDFIIYLSYSRVNQSERLTKLANYLVNIDSPNKEAAFKAVYQNGNAYDDLAFRQLETKLLALVKRYIAVTQFEEDGLAQVYYELKSFQKRGEVDLQEECIKKMRANLSEQQNNKGSDYYYKQFETAEEQYHYDLINRPKATETSISLFSQLLDEFYVFNKLKYFCEVINQKNIIQIKNEIVSVNALLSQIQIENYKHHSGIFIYYHVLKMLMDPDKQEHFLSLEKYLLKNYSEFSNREARNMFVFAQNYCIQQSNRGRLAYLEKLFKLYSVFVDGGLLYVNNKIPPQTFKNIVAIALRINKIKWAEDFINQYSEWVNAEYKQNAVDYNLANLFYYRKNYKKCLQRLQKVNFKDAFYGFDARILLIKTYFEQGDYDALDRFLFGFYLFIKRNKFISQIHKTNYLNFIRYLKNLMKLKKYSPLKQLNRIEFKIKNADQVTNKGWLLEMLAVKKKECLVNG